MGQVTVKWVKKYTDLNWALIDQVMVSGSNFLSGILLARYLGIEEFGRFSLAWLGLLFFLGLQNAAIIAPMMSLGPKQGMSERQMYYSTVMVQQTCFAAVLALFIWIVFVIGGPQVPEWGLETLAVPLICALLTSQFHNFLRRLFFTQMRGFTAIVCDIIRYPGQTLIIIIWTQVQDMDAVDALWVIAATSGLSLVFAANRIERPAWNRAFLFETIRRHWHFSKWLISTEILRLVTQNLLIIVAGTVLGVAAVGALKATQQLFGGVHVLIFGLDNIIPIRAAKLMHESGRVAIFSYIWQFALLSGLAIGLIVGLVVVAPEFWLGLFYGSEFLDYGGLVQWWAINYMVGFFSIPGIYGLRALEQTRFIFWAQIFAAIFAIVFCYPLIQHFGLFGVMIGLLFIHIIKASIITITFTRAVKS